MTWYRYDPARDVLTLCLHVQPNASRSEFAGLHGTALKVRIAAPASDFKANALLIDFLRKSFQLPAGKVIITRGRRSRGKIVEIAGGGPQLLARIHRLLER
ncbi:MAG: DUF167 domain-containing protein [Burkholderiales bacterium]